ncbi:MAG: flagellar biosynthetic protein FliP, partial [Firmicutes bacterium]|nr:flagellar biosynthetic protein FliP [Bacillota bacterium]
MKYNKYMMSVILGFTLLLLFTYSAYAEPTKLEIPKIGVTIDGAETPQEMADSLRIVFLLTILSLAPSFLIMMTSFTRIIIVLSFTRSAMGTQQMPPNQVLVGLALFLTLFIMTPIISDINTNAYQPLIS